MILLIILEEFKHYGRCITLRTKFQVAVGGSWLHHHSATAQFTARTRSKRN